MLLPSISTLDVKNKLSGSTTYQNFSLSLSHSFSLANTPTVSPPPSPLALLLLADTKHSKLGSAKKRALAFFRKKLPRHFLIFLFAFFKPKNSGKKPIPAGFLGFKFNDRSFKFLLVFGN